LINGLRIRYGLIPDAFYAARITLDLGEITPHISGPDTVQVMQSLAGIEKKKVAIQKAYLISCANSRLEDLEAAAWVMCGKRVAPGVKLYLGAASAWVQQEARDAWYLADAARRRRESSAARMRAVHRPRSGIAGKG
jgi:homoaconitate hydratase